MLATSYLVIKRIFSTYTAFSRLNVLVFYWKINHFFFFCCSTKSNPLAFWKKKKWLQLTVWCLLTIVLCPMPITWHRWFCDVDSCTMKWPIINNIFKIDNSMHPTENPTYYPHVRPIIFAVDFTIRNEWEIKSQCKLYKITTSKIYKEKVLLNIILARPTPLANSILLFYF